MLDLDIQSNFTIDREKFLSFFEDSDVPMEEIIKLKNKILSYAQLRHEIYIDTHFRPLLIKYFEEETQKLKYRIKCKKDAANETRN